MRIRIYFAKTEAMRFTGHLDLHKTWERTFRRSGLPLSYSQGFHPQPRLQLACALPLGFTSQAEILDAWLDAELPLEDIRSALCAAIPPGIRLQRIEIVQQPSAALQTQVLSAEYEITLKEDIPDLDDRIARLLAQQSILREWRHKPYDLRPLIEMLETSPANGADRRILRTRLAAREGATGRPEELLAALGIAPDRAKVHRTGLALRPG